LINEYINETVIVNSFQITTQWLQQTPYVWHVVWACSCNKNKHKTHSQLEPMTFLMSQSI